MRSLRYIAVVLCLMIWAGSSTFAEQNGDSGCVPRKASASLTQDDETVHAEMDECVYLITVTDENCMPVSNVMISICSDRFCMTAETDEQGVCTFTGKVFPYVVELLKVPEGYARGTSIEYIMEKTELTITLPHS